MKMTREEKKIRNAKIRELKAAGVPVKMLSEEFNLHRSMIHKISNEITPCEKPVTKKFTDEQFIELINKECTFVECAKQLRVCYGTILNRARMLNIESPARISSKKIEEMMRLRDSGFSNEEIGKRVGVATSSVWLHIGAAPEEITNTNKQRGAKIRWIRANAKQKSRSAMIDRRKREAIAEIENRRAMEEMLRKEEERKIVQLELNDFLGFDYLIETAEQGKNILAHIREKFTESLVTTQEVTA